MPRRPPPIRRWLTAATWPVGVALTSWDYMWRITPLHRREVCEADTDGHLPPPLPAAIDHDEIVGPDGGHGPLFHRRYRTAIAGAEVDAAGLMARLRADLNRAAPTTFARFQRVLGEDGPVRAGDEFVVRMPGPWDGPVRVVTADDRSFRLATLAGHLEAGQIEFRALDRGDGGCGGSDGSTRSAGEADSTAGEADFTAGEADFTAGSHCSGGCAAVAFEIESWARSADRLADLLYHRIRMAKEVQLHMWISFLEGVAALAGGRIVGGVDIDTRRVEPVP